MTHPALTANARAPSLTASLSLAAQVAGVFTVLLPVSGAVIRYVAYRLTPGISTPSKLAVAASLSELAAAGLGLVGLMLLLLVFAAFFPLVRGRPPIPRDQGILMAVLLVAVVVLIPGLSTTVPTVIAVLASMWLAVAPVTTRVGSRGVLVGIGVFVLALSAMYGATYPGEGPATYDFDPLKTSLPSGHYVRVGERDDLVFLLTCPDLDHVEAVHRDAIKEMTFPRFTLPVEASLLDIVTGRGQWPRFGLPDC
jgi:hypothetical protein